MTAGPLLLLSFFVLGGKYYGFIICIFNNPLHPPPSNNGTQIASSNVQPTSSVYVDNKASLIEGTEPLTASEAIVAEAEQKLETKKKEALHKAVEELNEYVKSMDRGLSFRLDEESGRQVITVFEVSSGDIIRQIPDEKMLEVARDLAASASGLIAERI